MSGEGRVAASADAFVLDLDSRAGLSIARTLGRAGLRVAAASKDSRASGLGTRYAAVTTVLPDPETDFAGFVRSLADALAACPADATLAATDWSVEALHRNRGLFGAHTAPAIAAPDAVEVALDKERTLEVARSVGIATPRSVSVESLDRLSAAVAEIGTPCVLKPVTSWQAEEAESGRRVSPLYAADVSAAESAARALLRPGAPVLVQEVVPGARETIKLFRDRGSVRVRFAMLIDRTWPPLGGSSVMRRSIVPPADALAAAERLVAEIGLDGYSEVEFRRDRGGAPVLMEVNPRLSQSVELAVRAGVDFPRLQLEWARGGRLPEVPAPTIGLRVGWLGGDLRLLAGAFGGAAPPRPRIGPVLSGIAADYTLHRARLDGFDLHDLRPTLGAVAFPARALAARLPLRRPGTRHPSG